MSWLAVVVVVKDFYYAEHGWSSERGSPLPMPETNVTYRDRGFTAMDPINPITIGIDRSAADYID